MILDVDIGNSRVKWRLLSGRGCILKSGACDTVDALIVVLEGCSERVERARVSCVSQLQQLEELTSWLQQKDGIACEVAQVSTSAVGITNAYEYPCQLGVDRWLAIIGAHALVAEPFVVVDAGSALTIDVVVSGGRHLGGYIIPGLMATAEVLQRKTARVRFDKTEWGDRLDFGRNTQQAVSHGILRSQVALVEGVVRELAGGGQGPSPRAVSVLATGGDAQLLANCLSIPCSVVSDLVFKGIEILIP